jgi:hypothetical protein
MACAGNPDEAKVRICRDESFTVLRRCKDVTVTPDKECRRRQRLPTLAEDDLRSIPEPSEIGDAVDQADHALDVSSHVRDIDVEDEIVDSLGMLDDDLTPELAARVSRRVREEVPAERLPDEREPKGKQLARHTAPDSGGSPDEYESGNAAGSVACEGDGPERADRLGDYVYGRELECIEDVAQECPSVVEQIDTAVVERIGQPVARPIDGENAVVLRESPEDRYDLERAAQSTMDVQEWCAGADFEDLRLTL